MRFNTDRDKQLNSIGFIWNTKKNITTIYYSQKCMHGFSSTRRNINLWESSPRILRWSTIEFVGNNSRYLVQNRIINLDVICFVSKLWYFEATMRNVVVDQNNIVNEIGCRKILFYWYSFLSKAMTAMMNVKIAIILSL